MTTKVQCVNYDFVSQYYVISEICARAICEVCLQTFRSNKIETMNTNMWWDFQICISVPL